MLHHEYRYTQSRTGGVLGAVPSAAVMGACRIFFHGGKFRDAKSWRFLVVTLKKQVFTVNTNAQNTYNISGGGKCPQNISFFFRRGACAMAQWHSGQSKPAGMLLCTEQIVTITARRLIDNWGRLNVSPNIYRSYRGRVFTGQVTQPTVSKHWRKIGPKDYASIPSGPPQPCSHWYYGQMKITVKRCRDHGT